MIMTKPFSAVSLNVAPRFVFLILYLVAAVTILLIFDGWSIERSDPSWLALNCWDLGLVVELRGDHLLHRPAGSAGA